MHVTYRDLREWLIQIKEIGGLKEVEGADVEEDAGRLAEMLSHAEDGPAVMMNAIPGYPKDHRLLINANGARERIAHTFGFNPQIDKAALVEALGKRLQSLQLLPPVVVGKGPVMENELKGDDVDLNRFPAPIWHLEDGGRYIGTGCYLITRDPEEEWVNLGTYRVMLQKKDQVGFYVSPGHHGWLHREKYFAKGRPCPVAVVLGGDPLLMITGSLEVPWGISEYDWAGGLRGEPYPVINDPVTGLPIPSEAEIVLVGYAHPGQKAPEGPFGEWTGYYASGSRDEPFINVEAIYYRNDPIILGTPPNRPPYEADKYREYIKSAMLLNDLRRSGVPGVKAVWCHGVGGCRLLIALAIEQRYTGHAAQAGHLASQLPAGAYLGRLVIVTDDDIDISDLEELMWAICTRCDPATDLDIIHRAWSGPLDPLVSPEARAKGEFYNSRMIINATRPWSWRDQFPKAIGPDREYRRRTREKWGHLLK
ncbi:MAG: UbiD family decarboxylase [Pseudomonadota bacterium]